MDKRDLVTLSAVGRARGRTIEAKGLAAKPLSSTRARTRSRQRLVSSAVSAKA
jgi:hypothetical protein